jgi:hypothetical protein
MSTTEPEATTVPDADEPQDGDKDAATDDE